MEPAAGRLYPGGHSLRWTWGRWRLDSSGRSSPGWSSTGNQPDFAQEEYTTEAFETYAPLDALGRCGTAYANLCPALMPTQPRGEIGQVKPAGWHTVKYDWVDGKYLYNRCHLIGYQLAGRTPTSATSSPAPAF